MLAVRWDSNFKRVWGCVTCRFLIDGSAILAGAAVAHYPKLPKSSFEAIWQGGCEPCINCPSSSGRAGLPVRSVEQDDMPTTLRAWNTLMINGPYGGANGNRNRCAASDHSRSCPIYMILH